MKNILVLGSGMVSRPLVRYLLGHNFRVTAADIDKQAAKRVVNNHPNGKAVELDVTDRTALAPLVADADVAVSILPPPFHPIIAQACLDQGTHLVTSSYVSNEMEAMASKAQAQGLTFLNELGLDPGIDHMTAMEVIHRVQSEGGQVVSFSSYCGGLPAPEANNNPFGYKFSWAPFGVFDAMVNEAIYRQGSRKKELPNDRLFAQPSRHTIDDIGQLEGYPNRDSLKYIKLYGLQGIKNMRRGTLRNPGWCRFWHNVCKEDFLDKTPLTTKPKTIAEFTAQVIGINTTENLDKQFARAIDLDANDQVITMARWLGLFSSSPIPYDAIPRDKGISFRSITSVIAKQKMAYAPGERDMSVMQHKFEVLTATGVTEKITSTLLVFGTPNGDSSMAKIVGGSAAIGARFIAEGVITTPGVQIPVTPEIYQPVLAELEALGIKMSEEVETVG